MKTVGLKYKEVPLKYIIEKKKNLTRGKKRPNVHFNLHINEESTEIKK